MFYNAIDKPFAKHEKKSKMVNYWKLCSFCIFSSSDAILVKHYLTLKQSVPQVFVFFWLRYLG